MASLYFRYGDPQALKPIIAAAASLKLVPLADESEDDCPLRLVLADNITITESNAMAQALVELPLEPVEVYSQVYEWLEWEETVLRPLIYSRDDQTAKLQQTLAPLKERVESNNEGFLVPVEPTLADIVIFSTLFHMQNHQSIPLSVQGYLQKLAQLPAFQEGIKKMLGERNMSSCVAIIQEDIRQQAAAQPKVPIPGERNILVTSALPYVNNVPHLGNIIGCVLSADCFARFCRARGYNTIYICGTDEYGTATETKAYEEGASCEEICDKYHTIHKGIYEWFEISCDKFGRTPTRHQTQIAQEIFKSLHTNGNLSENEMQQLFSEALGKFLADRFVTGTCPKCNYEDARGDQCDQCGTLLNPTELIDPKCKFTGTTPLMKTTKHIFLDLPSLVAPLQSYIEETSQCGGWSSNSLQITNAWIRDGLKQRCITRDLKWGVPVPLPGYENKVFYVWFDAPIGYISITAAYTAEWEKWWKNPEQVEMVQFMGKDNVPFHTVIFPATLIGTGQKWTMMKRISVTEYLNYESGKFSKTRGIGVFGDNARDSGIPVEIWRYYLLSNRPESQDTTFSWDNLGAQNNSELLNNLGNFINRALKFVEKFYNSVVPDATANGEIECQAFGSELLAKVKAYIEKMEAIQMKPALSIVLDISATGNKFLQDHKPWELVKQDADKCKTVVRAGVGLARLLAALLQPFMPSISKKILQQMNIDWHTGTSLKNDDIEAIQNPCSIIPIGHKINQPVPLFVKITDEQLADFRERFKGKQVEAPPASSKKRHYQKTPTTEQPELKKPTATNKQNATKEPDISRVDIRVGFIKNAWKHAEADKLYVEEIDVGEDSCRTVVSGLVQYIPLDQMQQRHVLVICNMKPVNMRGIQSEAMVLAATSSDGTRVELLKPPQGSKAGMKVTVDGYDGEPDAVLNPKKKVLESILKELKTNADCVACYADQPLKLPEGGLCTSDSISDGSIH